MYTKTLIIYQLQLNRFTPVLFSLIPFFALIFLFNKETINSSTAHIIHIIKLHQKKKENTLAPLRNYTKPVRIKDVALAADVSTSTVSLVLNNKHKERQISDKVVQRVLLKARELGYIPNAAARQMRQKLNQITVSFISPFEAPLIMVNHWLVAMGNILKSYKTSKLNLSITVEPYHAGYLDELLHQTTHQAAIIANTIKEDDEYLAQTNLPFPVVLIGRSIPGYSSVLFDMKESGQKAHRFYTKLDAGNWRL